MHNTPATLWFAGTPEFAAYSLEQLCQHPKYRVTGVLTQPDRPAGRGQKLQQSAVKQTAQQYNLPFIQPQRLTPELSLFDHTPDLIIVAAYGLLLPSWFLQLPRLGCINIHASLLPRWRGAAPIQRAIAAGDTQSGISIMQMDEGLDTGDIWLQQSCSITPTTTAETLHNQLMHLGAQTLLQALPHILAQTNNPTPQDNTHATYAHKLSKAEAAINWQHSASTIERHIRAYNPYPVAHSTLETQNWRIFSAQALPNNPNASPAEAGTILAHHQHGIDVQTGEGILRLQHIQLAGKTKCHAADLRHGHHLTGLRFNP